MQTLGVYGSGLDTNAIVSALVNAEVAPLTSRINRLERERSAELSSLGTLTSSLESIESSLESLGDGSAFDALSISDSSAVSVLQSGTASPGDFELSISRLASSQSLYSTAFSATSSVVGTGTLTIALGAPAYVSGTSGNYADFTAASSIGISIDSSNNTVADIRDAINADAGVTAAILLDGNDVRLVVTADDTGADNAISITVSDDDGTDTDGAGLSQLAYHFDSSSASHVGNLSESRGAEDASFTLNGISLTSESNVINGLIDGLDFTLNAETTAAVKIAVRQDQASIKKEIEAFVDAYNSFQSGLSRLMSYDQSLGAGVLQGDSMARQLASSMRSSLTDEITGLTGNITLLSSLGITSDRYGQLSIDDTELTNKLSTDTSGVKEFFSGDGVTEGAAHRIVDTISTYTNVSSGLIISRENSIDAVLNRLEDEKLVIERRRASLEERYIRQFAAMDALVGQLQSTSDFLTNQLKNIPGQNAN